MHASKSLFKRITLPSGKTLSLELNPQTLIVPDGEPLSKADRRAILRVIADFHESLLADAP